MRIIIIFLTIVSNALYSQGEADNWYFGDHVGLDFSIGDPIPIEDSGMYAEEGCASISDQEGDLLFYTNGLRVWNRENNIMPNGWYLFGNYSSTQSAIIVKQPQSDNIYYIFTLEAEGLPNGLSYSIVDMSLDSSRGDVTEKNINLLSQADEKITAIGSENGEGFWILTKLYHQQIFYAYYLDQNGFNSTPIISEFDPVEDPSVYGYLKASHDGTIVMSCQESPFLYNFNNETGELSNPIEIELMNTYSAEFSKNDHVLYLSNWAAIDGNNIMQYDLSVYNDSAINSSLHILGDTIGGGALQMGPDDKIYYSDYYRGSLSVINNPNLLGDSCNLEIDAITFSSGVAIYGLPNFYNSIFNPPIDNPIIPDPLIEMPNIFTPNNDGSNDVFLPLELKDVLAAQLEVFNRWGNQLYSGPLEKGWDGIEASEGVYYWHISYKDQNGINKGLNGYVTLVR